MSDGPIKPSDITEEMLRGKNAWSWLGADFFATVLNAAIESGIVSPPCHYYERDGRRDRSIELLKLWPGKPQEKYCKHWKGEE